MSNKSKINSDLANRKNVFYWQTDRNISPKDAGLIWKDRHKYFVDDQIIEAVNAVLKGEKLISLDHLDSNSQTSLGNVNSVRVGHLQSGKIIVIRNHPRGVENGYFYVESLASSLAKSHGIPSYSTLAIYDINNENDYSFQVIEELPGVAVTKYLEEKPAEEEKVLFEIGKTMADLHKIKVEGFGPFDNQLAKKGELRGLHPDARAALYAGFEFNCEVLEKENLLTSEQITQIKSLFSATSLLEDIEPVLIHNDFADWNLLVDKSKISGVVDFDECVGGDPVMDIACWSTFFYLID